MNCPIPPLSLTAARTRILNTLIPLTATEPVDLATASGRILAEPLRACRDLPPFACSAMDGYALRHADLAAAATLTVVGTVYAGSPWSGHLAAGQCVRIFTGAPLPAAADTVVMQEQVQRDGDIIRITGQPGPGEHVRPQGDETRCGEYLLAAGQRLTPEHIGLLASQGLASVRVRQRPRITLLTTGDELCPLGREPGPGQIYDSNRYLLRALLAEQGLTAQDQGIIPDQPERLRQALVQAAATADVIITTGGASVGDADWLVDAARQLGEHLRSRAAEEDRFEPLADLVQVAVAGQVPFLVQHAVVLQELERRAEPAFVDELHDAVELFELVLQWRAGELFPAQRHQPAEGTGLPRSDVGPRRLSAR